ncbi:hypothetical protein IEQ34_016082 [Dendrobium chrysotoxum]|uniref:Uncharacterized protein n=1 Tax=Dendrobium chrysotoxum TaxID=161865 RepID=A0AAV7GFI2_DENCH|nr:hypothetical protein IEQ34_016082 [Dendrobium chrysotoxum]
MLSIIRPPVLRSFVSLPISPQCIRLLSVHGVVTNNELVVRHSKRDGSANNKADNGGHNDVPADNEKRADNLF